MQPTGPTIRVFGGAVVEDVDGPVSIGGHRQRRLLALLAIRANTVVTIDWLAEQLWSDDDRPDAAVPAIRTYLSRLRSALPDAAQDWITTEPSGYRLTAPPEAVEHQRFRLLRAEAERARNSEDPQRAEEALAEASGLWRGEPFSELEDLDWARADIEQLRLERLEMQEERWEAALALGRHTQITGELATFTSEHVGRERAVRQYALALHRSSRTTEALRSLQRYRDALANETGLEPSPELTELENAILINDESLAVEKVGRPLRGYRLLEEAGVGAFSVVWRGVQPSVDREVAIKQIRSELASQPDFIRRFEAEAHLVARLEHPHIVPLIDFWREPDSAYLVMRWLRGGTLERQLDNGPMSVGNTITLATQIGSALSAAHAHSIIHRDVKSANILLDEKGIAYLGDFGIALAAAESSGPEAAISPGSPAYASPEQIRREPLGPAADVFSLGVVLFECLTGSLPFPNASSQAEVIDRQMNDPYPLVSDIREDVPSAIAAAIERATTKDRVDRFQTIDEFVAALGGGGGSTVRPAIGDVTNPYKGLRAFDEGDAKDFFGRERVVTKLVSRLSGDSLDARFVALVGPSGSGKSSIVRAGLLPALRSGAAAGSAEWFSTTMVPGVDPYESLEAALLRIAVNPPASLIEQLRTGERGILRSIRRCLPEESSQVALTIDQFEELFTRSSPDVANTFLDALCVAIGEPTAPLRLIITLRADYYHRPLEHPAFSRVLSDATVNITPLAADELERAIVEPARQLGVEFESGLAARIGAEAAGQPSPLPMLQYTLSELFEQRAEAELTASAYDEMGGLSGALAARAEALYGEGVENQQAAVRTVFGRLTNPEEASSDLRRRVDLADFGDDPASAWVVQRFGDARLLSFDRDLATREPTVEVAHEALLREWPRLTSWLSDDVETLQLADQVRTASKAWHDGGQLETDLYRGARLSSAVALADAAPERLRKVDTDFITASAASSEAGLLVEQRRVKRLRRLVVAVGAALIVALVAGGFALRAQQRADDEAAAATLAADDALEQSRIANEQSIVAREAADAADFATLISRSAALVAEDPEVATLLALEANRRSPGPESEQAILNALGGTSVATRIAQHDNLWDEECQAGWISSELGTEFTIAGGSLLSRDLLSGEVFEHGAPPAPCVSWEQDPVLDRRYANSEDGLTSWFGPVEGPWDLEVNFNVPTYRVSNGFSAHSRSVMLAEESDGIELSLFDDTTGEFVGDPISAGNDFYDASVSPDGQFARLAFGERGRAEGDGLLFVLDGETGAQLFQVDTQTPIADGAWDTENNRLIVMTFDGQVLGIDLATGMIASRVAVDSTANVLSMRLRNGSEVLVVSESQAEVVDLTSGPTGEAFALRAAVHAWTGPDGIIITVTPGNTLAVFDLTSNPLIAQEIDADVQGHWAFNDGFAGTLFEGAQGVDIVELETGERRTPSITMPDGSRFPATKIYPEHDGLWAISRNDMVVTRWQDDELVEEFDIGGTFVTGTRYEDTWAIISDQDDARVVDLLNLEREATGILFRVPADNATETHPTRDGGVHVIHSDGTLRTYNSEGMLTGEIQSGATNVGGITIDPVTGKVAVGEIDATTIIDPATGEIQDVPGDERVVNLGFGRNGELLTIVTASGTVRLWDVERNQSAGIAWTGPGATPGSPSWYDDATSSIWVNAGGKLLRIPLDPERWIENACASAARSLTQAEWDRYVPGDEPLWDSCI